MYNKKTYVTFPSLSPFAKAIVFKCLFTRKERRGGEKVGANDKSPAVRGRVKGGTFEEMRGVDEGGGQDYFDILRGDALT